MHMAATLTNREIADVFYAISDTMEVLGEDVFRSRACKRAGDAIVDLPASLAVLRANGELDPVFPALARRSPRRSANCSTPASSSSTRSCAPRCRPVCWRCCVCRMSARARPAGWHSEFGIASLADLKAAAESGKLDKVKGFGPNGRRNHTGHQRRRKPRQAHTNDRCAAGGRSLIDALRKASPAVRDASYAGSLRRARETIGDLDILASSDDPAAAVRAFIKLPQVARVRSSGEEKATVYLQNGLQADLIALPPHMWGSALQHFTGGKQHNIRFREMAINVA